MKRTYDEPIPFVPQADKGNVQKPKEIKLKLRQNPANANSPKIEKVFLEFVENTAEAFCCWRCDMEEYIKGAGIVQPAAKIQASTQLLSQAHKTTWENMVQQVVPGGAVTTEQEVEDIYARFALTFMNPTARRKQKRYMASGNIQKPKSWSSRQVAMRLTTLNRYLQYLPGAAGEFTADELKDILLDTHPATYQHLMTRANYDMDTQTYLQVTQYLQNLSLIEESFRQQGNKHPGNSEAKAHKGGKKNHKHQKKHGKDHCRKHPHGDHTWLACHDNPKGPNYKGNKNNNKNNSSKKAEARNMDTDSDADMDKTLSMPNIDNGEEVSDLTLELEVSKAITNSTSPSLVSTVNNNSIPVKKNVRFLIDQNTSNKKRRLLNKQHHCHMQTPLSRKLRKVDDTSSTDLTTEVTALVKNVTGTLPTKLTRVLIDTGCSKTLIKKECIPNGLQGTKKSVPIVWNTNGGKFNTKYEIPLTIILPEFSSSMEVQWSCAIDENPDSTYDMIIGRDLQFALKLDISFSTSSLIWNEIAIPMRTGQQRSKEALNAYLDSVIETSSEPEILREELYEAKKILDSDYKKADLDEVVRNIPHLTEEQKIQVRTTLYQYESLFEGRLGLWDTPPISLELEEGSKPYHARAYPIPQIHEATVRKEVERLCKEGVLEKDSNSEWAAPTFIVPKKEGTVRFVTDFRQLNKALKRKPFPIPNIQDILQKIGGFTYATALDLNMGYYNVRV